MKWYGPCSHEGMKKIFFILLSLLVLSTIVRVPGLQAEDWVGDRISFPLICGQEEGKPGFPILCLEGVSAKQLDDVRGKYADGVALSAIESADGENRIILWDEPKRTAVPQMSVSTGNNQTYSVLTAISYQ